MSESGIMVGDFGDVYLPGASGPVRQLRGVVTGITDGTLSIKGKDDSTVMHFTQASGYLFVERDPDAKPAPRRPRRLRATRMA